MSSEELFPMGTFTVYTPRCSSTLWVVVVVVAAVHTEMQFDPSQRRWHIAYQLPSLKAQYLPDGLHPAVVGGISHAVHNDDRELGLRS